MKTVAGRLGDHIIKTKTYLWTPELGEVEYLNELLFEAHRLFKKKFSLKLMTSTQSDQLHLL